MGLSSILELARGVVLMSARASSGRSTSIKQLSRFLMNTIWQAVVLIQMRETDWQNAAEELQAELYTEVGDER